MDFSLAFFGLGLIALAWLIQVVFSLKGAKQMRPCFAAFQFLGIGLLVTDTILNMGQMDSLAWMNVVTGVGAFIMFVLLLKK